MMEDRLDLTNCLLLKKDLQNTTSKQSNKFQNYYSQTLFIKTP